MLLLGKYFYRFLYNFQFLFSILKKEFREGRKASQTAPQIIYSVGEPPLELKNCSEAKIGPNVGYITFGIFNLFKFLILLFSSPISTTYKQKG